MVGTHSRAGLTSETGGYRPDAPQGGTGLTQLPHLPLRRGHPCHICTATGLTPATSAATGLASATSAPGLGSPLGGRGLGEIRPSKCRTQGAVIGRRAPNSRTKALQSGHTGMPAHAHETVWAEWVTISDVEKPNYPEEARRLELVVALCERHRQENVPAQPSRGADVAVVSPAAVQMWQW